MPDEQEGLGILEALKDAINATWEKRFELLAVTTARRAPRWLDILSLLPQTNCQRCGEATCMAFAAALLQQNRVLTECLPLAEDPAFGDRKASLQGML